MKTKIKVSTYILALSCWLVACSEDTNNVIKPGDKPVVAAYLAPNQPVLLTVFTEKPYSFDNTTKALPIDGLVIRITDDKGSVFTLSNEKGGTYKSSISEKIAGIGSTYQLNFSYKGREISAKTIIPPKPTGFKMDKTELAIAEFSYGSGTGSGGVTVGTVGGTGTGADAVQLVWTNPERNYHFVGAINTTQNPVSIYPLPSGVTINSYNGYTQPPSQGNKSSLDANSFLFYGRYGIVLYRLNPDYAALFKDENTSSQNISTPTATIANGLGIFTGVNTDTLFLNIKKK